MCCPGGSPRAAGLAKDGGGRSQVGDQGGEDQRVGGVFVVVSQRVVKGNDRFSSCPVVVVALAFRICLVLVLFE